jgi:hypothetical protein
MAAQDALTALTALPSAPAPDAKRPPAAHPAKPKTRFARGVAIEPTPIPTPAPKHAGHEQGERGALHGGGARRPTDAPGLLEAFASPRPHRKERRYALVGMLRQAVFGRLAGYEDVNDAERAP